MPVCEQCRQSMDTSDGCQINNLIIAGRRYKRIPFGHTEDLMTIGNECRCRDCNAKEGYYHHWGCDAERCPACGLQLFSCECDDIGTDES